MSEYCNCSARSRSSPLREILHESKEEYEDSERRYRSPCRRTCSTIHNPAFHYPRVSLKPSRPRSADKVKEHIQRDAKSIDWRDSLFNKLIPKNVLKQLNDVLEESDTDSTHRRNINTGMNTSTINTNRQSSNFDTITGKTISKDLVSSNESSGVLRRIRRIKDKTFDMQQIYKSMDQDAIISKRLKIMSHQEVDHTYNLMKNESLREQTLKEIDYFQLIDRIQSTLQYLMKSLLLAREYEMLISSYHQKT